MLARTTPGTKRTKTALMVVVSFVIALLLFAGVGVSRAQAAESYSAPKAFACGGGWNSGSYDDNGVLYLPCGTSASSTIYKVQDGKADAVTGALGFHVSDVAPSPTGKHLYLARGNSTPVRLDRNDATGMYSLNADWKLAGYTWKPVGKPGWTISEPTGKYIATDSLANDVHNVYVAEGGWSHNNLGTVIKYDSSGKYLTNFGEGVDIPAECRVANPTPEQKLACQNASQNSPYWDDGRFYWQLNGLEVTRDGSKVYTVEGGNNRIQRFDLSGGTYSPNTAAKFGSNATNNRDREAYCDYADWNGRFASPYNIGIDSTGNLYVLNTTCNQVIKFSGPNQDTYTSADLDGGGGALPHGLAVDDNGDFYVGEAGRWVENLNAGGTPNTVPTITDVAPAEGTSVPDGKPLIKATVRDAEQDLAESNTKLFLDGVEIPAERRAYDQGTDILSHAYDGAQPLPAGTHTVKVEATDGVAATPTVKTWTFTVPNNDGGGGGGTTPTCDRWASNQGNDGSSGEQNAPVQSVNKLITILAPGQTGCLKPGQTFNEVFSAPTTAGGDPGNPVTIRSEPNPNNARATFTGQLRVLGDDITFTDINFAGLPTHRGASHLRIDAHRVKLVGNDIQNPMGICVDVGETETGDRGVIKSSGFVLSKNRVHNCGTGITDQTADDSGAHALYFVNTQGATISDNYIYDNQDRGIQLYPDSDGTTVEHNVLDGNGTNVNMGHEGTRFSENNQVRNNLITNATLPPVTGTNTSQVHGNFPDDGNTRGNVVSNNCLWYEKAELRTYDKYFDGHGYVESNNKFVNPLYKDRAAKNFAVQAGECAGMGPRTDTVDPMPPTVADMLPANGSTTTNKRPPLSATVRDDSTLTKANIKLYVDDVLMGDNRYAYNSTTGELTRVFEDGIDPDFEDGSHTVKIVATDSGGLATTGITTFTVDADPDPSTCLGVATTRTGGIGADTITGVENQSEVVDAQEGGDTFTNLDDATQGGDRFCGGDGNDTFKGQMGGGGVVRFDGGNASMGVTDNFTDTISYRAWNSSPHPLTTGVDVQLSGGNPESPGDANAGWMEAGSTNHLLYNISDVEGSDLDDSLRGNNKNNSLYGYGGEDHITGNAGGDHLDGGDGQDTIDAADGFRDTVDCGAGGFDSATVDEGLDVVSNCENADETAPTGRVLVKANQPYTNTAAVTLSLSASDGAGSGVEYVLISNDGQAWTRKPFAATVPWTLSAGDGPKSVQVQFVDHVDNASVDYRDAITLDTRKPRVSAMAPKHNATIALGGNVSAAFDDLMMASSLYNPTTFASTTFTLRKGGATGPLVAARVTYSSSTKTAKLDPNQNLARGVRYYATVTTGAKDKAGNALDQNATLAGNQQMVWSFVAQ